MKVNRFTLIYLTIVILSFVLVREVLHSNRFASFISSEVTQWLKGKVDAEVEIGQIRLELLPFGMTLEDVSFKKDGLEATIASLEVEYGYRNLFKSDIVINEITLREGAVNLVIENEEKLSSEEEKEIDLKAIWQKTRDVISKQPVLLENLKVERIAFSVNAIRSEIVSAHLQISDEFSLIGMIDNFTIPEKLAVEKAVPDSVEFSLNLDDDSLWVRQFVIRKGLAVISANGELLIGKTASFKDFEMNVNGGDDEFTAWVPAFEAHDPTFNAYIESKLLINGTIKKPNIKANLALHNVTSRHALAERIVVSANWENDRLKLQELLLEHKGGWLTAKSEQEYILDEKILERGIQLDQVELHQLPTASVFHFLDGTLDALVANMSGKLSMLIRANGLKINGLSPLKLDDFKLQLSPTPDPSLLAHKSPALNQLKLELDFEPFKLNLAANLTTEKTSAPLDALIDGNGIKAKISGDKFSLTEFEQIQNVPVNGDGKLDITVEGPWDNIVFGFKGEMEDTRVANYDLGRTNLEGQLLLKQGLLNFNKIAGRQGFTQYKGGVRLELNNNSYPLKISFNSKRALLTDIRKMVSPIVPEFLKEVEELQMRFETHGELAIDFNDQPIKIDLSIDGDSLQVFGENFDSVAAKIKMLNKRLSVQGFTLSREKSRGTGQVFYDVDSEYLEYEFSMGDMSLSSFNLYRMTPLALEGQLNLDVYGSGILGNDHSLRSTITLENSTIKRESIDDSRLDIYYSNNEWTARGTFIDGLAQAEVYIPMKQKGKKSVLKFDLAANKIAPLVGILAPVRMTEASLQGRAYAHMEALFDLEHPELADITFDLRDLYLTYRKKNLRIAQSPILKIHNGVFERWTFLSAPESDLRFKTVVDGSLSKKFALTSDYTIPAEFFELASDRLIDMVGTLEGRLNFERLEGGEIKSFLSHNAREVQFRLADIPGRFSNLTLDASLNDKEIFIENLSGQYGRGRFAATGKVTLDFPYPSFSLRLNANDITYPLFNRSDVNLDARLTFVGTRPPYLFSGQALLQEVNLSEDVGTYLGHLGGGSSYERFIPNTAQSFVNEFVEVDLNVMSNNSIRVSNPLMELVLGARLKLTGELLSPTIDGVVEGAASRSKISFKGHEFALSKANVDFNPTEGVSKSILDLAGRTTVSGYNVDLLVNGALDQMNIALSSEPALPQDEIVSLLTLGITSDISRNLNEEDRRSITTMSLGGFLFDQLQLTRGLDSNLGLKVSLAPEFSTDEGNLIEEASSDTASSRRLRTGTKLRVQSQLGKKTSVSFSSTLGGEVEQRQQMNVNYDFNRAWSVEGVYELKSSVEENQGDTQSLGADVKFRWSF